MSLHIFNNAQKLIKVISNDDLFSLVQEQELNKIDMLSAEVKLTDWEGLEEKPFYMAVNDPYERFVYHMYKVTQETVNHDTVQIQGINIAFDELKAHGYIKDRRFQDSRPLDAMNAIVDGTDWVVGYVDDELPKVNTNFYYISRLEALGKLIDTIGGEVKFRVEVSGNKVMSKRIDIYKQLSKFKGRRFALGSQLIEVVKEEDSSELYTALVGRGKGEELEGEDAYGRRITFKDVEWKRSAGDPVDKPLGQEYVELPERTSTHGYPDGTPRTGIVEFTDTEEQAELLQQTYEALLNNSRPLMQFKAVVETAGDMELGETVAIVKPETDFRYKTRVFKVRRDYLNNYYTEVEFGDRLTQTMGERINKIDTTINAQKNEVVEIVQRAANGKNKIYRQKAIPTTGMAVNDLWYEPVGEGELIMHRWDGEMWQIEKISGGLLGGTIDAASGDLDIINMNANNITANATDFVRSSWNDIAGNTRIDGTGIEMLSGSRWRTTRLNSIGLELRNGIDSSVLSGHVGYFKANLEDQGVNEAVINTGASGNHYIGMAARETHHVVLGYVDWANNYSYRRSLQVNGNDGKIRIYRPLHPGVSETEVELRTYASYQGSSNVIGWFSGNNLSNNIFFTNSTTNLTGEVETNFYTLNKNKMTIRDDIMARTDIYMTAGTKVHGPSDIRLKKNVTDTTMNALREIEKMRFIDFEWDKTKPNMENATDERQFGIQSQYAKVIQGQSADDHYESIDYTKQATLNSKAIQELLELINKQNATIERMEGLLNG